MNCKKAILTVALTLSLSAAAFAGDQVGDQVLVYYTDIAEPNMIDTAPQGPSLGDIYVRNGIVRSSQNGPVIGEYYTQATIIALDSANQKSARSYTSECVLPEGTIYKMDIVQFEHGHPVKEGHKHTGAIIGGTGKYAGIRGVYHVEVLKGGKAAKVTHEYWLGQ